MTIEIKVKTDKGLKVVEVLDESDIIVESMDESDLHKLLIRLLHEIIERKIDDVIPSGSGRKK